MNETLFAQLESGLGYEHTNKNNILNPYVNFFNHENTQTLHETMASESVQMRGVECYYIRRDMPNIDWILGECVSSRFEHAFKTCFYIKNFEGYEGDRDFFGRYGLQVNDELQLATTRQLFFYHVDQKMPLEGDLIYFPMGNALFEVTWVEGKDPFYQVGKNPIFNITAQKFIYSGEAIAVKTKKQIVPEALEGLDMNDIVDIDDEYFEDILLSPVNMVNGRGDLNRDQYVVDKQFEEEANEFVDPLTWNPINGSGKPVQIKIQPQESVFDDF